MGNYWINGREVSADEYNSKYLDSSTTSAKITSGKETNKDKKRNTLLTVVITVVAVLSVIIGIYFVSGAVAEVDQISKLYNSVASNIKSSGDNFDRPILYLIHKKDGSVEVTFTLTSEYLAEHQDEIERVETPAGNGPSNTLTLDADAQEVRDALTSTYPTKADAMAMAYQLINPTLGTNAAIGLMAQIANEGSFGVVEYAFSRSHDHGFQLPSGNSTVSSIDDINYLGNWESVDTGYYGYSTKKGSCGVGAIQWSFGRRINLIDIYKSLMSTDSDVTSGNLAAGEASMMAAELSPGTSYYNTVSRNVTEDTVECWAEAFCDYYILPRHCCPNGSKMSGSGTACQARKLTATEIARLLGGL